MILFYNNTAEGAVTATVIKDLCQNKNIPMISVGCNDPRAISLKTATTLLSVGRPSRKDLVFVNLSLDPATEQFLSDKTENIRSVTCIGSVGYAVKTRAFDRLIQSNVIRLFNVSGENQSLEEQLGALFDDRLSIKKTLERITRLSHTLIHKERLCD